MQPANTQSQPTPVEAVVALLDRRGETPGPALQQEIVRRCGQERARYDAWRRDCDRVSGVHLSGMEPDPFRPMSAAEILRAARDAERRADGPRGRFIRAIRALERAGVPEAATLAAIYSARLADEREPLCADAAWRCVRLLAGLDDDEARNAERALADLFAPPLGQRFAAE